MKGGLEDILRQAKKMQEEFQRVQGEAAKRTVEVTAGGGMVRVVSNGKMRIQSVAIDPQVLQMNDREMLQDLIVVGVNQALQAAQDMVAEEVGKLNSALGPFASLLKGL